MKNSIWENIFVINLQRRIDRWNHASKQFLKNGFSLSQVRRWAALDAARLCQEDSLCFEDILTPRAFSEFRLKTKTYHEQLSVGAVGCFLSHVQVWEEIVRAEIPAAVIFEDDLQFVDKFKTRFDQIWPSVPPDWDLVFLGSWHRRKPTKISSNVVRAKNIFLTHAYVIKGCAAAQLLKKAFPLEVQLDSYLSSHFDRLNSFCLKPSLVTQKKFTTDVQIPFAGFHKVKSRFRNWLQTPDRKNP
jgi:GR25 family glycosyltransferase involved in LPS biosynthesis